LKLKIVFAFSLLLVLTATLLPAPIKAQDAQVALLPCDCEPALFASAAEQAEQGVVYVYNQPEDGVKAFRVTRNNGSGNEVVKVVELENPDQQIVTALTRVLERASDHGVAHQASEFEALAGMASAVDLAARFALQKQLSMDISADIQSTITSDLKFLLERTRHSNMVSQAIGWSNGNGKRVKFDDGSYLNLKFSEAIVYENGDVSLQFEVKETVDSQGRIVGEATSDYVGRELLGNDFYVNHYRSLVSRLGFSVSVGCTTKGSTKLSCESDGTSCTVAYHKASC